MMSLSFSPSSKVQPAGVAQASLGAGVDPPLHRPQGRYPCELTGSIQLSVCLSFLLINPFCSLSSLTPWGNLGGGGNSSLVSGGS